jgi:hypothetical protein
MFFASLMTISSYDHDNSDDDEDSLYNLEHESSSGVGKGKKRSSACPYQFEDRNENCFDEEDEEEYDLDDYYSEDDQDDEPPSMHKTTVLWRHVLKQKKSGQGKQGGTQVFMCRHCKNIYHGSYTRVFAHLMGSLKGQSVGIAFCPVVAKNAELAKKIKRQVRRVEVSSSAFELRRSRIDNPKKPISMTTSSSGSRKTVDIRDTFKKVERDDVDHKIIRFLCANGIPFNVLRSPYWEEMISAVSKVPGYKPPSYEKARTTLLDSEKECVHRELNEFREKFEEFGVSIVSDGWTNIKNKHLINILASNCFGSMFLYASDFSNVQQSAANIAEFLKTGFKLVGPSNVVQVITDNATNCKLAGEELKQTYKYIFWSPCVVHTLNLIFKDLAHEFHWLGETYLQSKEIVKYITNHSKALAIFRSNEKLELIKIAKTRFASHYTTLKRLLDVRESLRLTVISDRWSDWKQSCTDEIMKKRAVTTETTVLDEEYWDSVRLALLITKPIYKMIKFCDQEGPIIGEVYEGMDNMLGEIKDNLKGQPDLYEKIHKIVSNRWDRMNVPLHSLAHMLTPKYYESEYLKIPAAGGVKRVSPGKNFILSI